MLMAFLLPFFRSVSGEVAFADNGVMAYANRGRVCVTNLFSETEACYWIEFEGPDQWSLEVVEGGISRDGRYVLFRNGWGYGILDVQEQAYLMVIDTIESEHSVALSPDGSQLARQTNNQIQIYNLYTGESTTVFDGCMGNLTWSPDGSSLVGTVGTSTSCQDTLSYEIAETYGYAVDDDYSYTYIVYDLETGDYQTLMVDGERPLGRALMLDTDVVIGLDSTEGTTFLVQYNPTEQSYVRIGEFPRDGWLDLRVAGYITH